MVVQESRVAMSQEQPVYQSYLLRLWSVRVDDDTIWRASLESSVTSQRQGFASLDDLCDFLKRQAGVGTSDQGGDEG
jgi:hypothetical protein